MRDFKHWLQWNIDLTKTLSTPASNIPWGPSNFDRAELAWPERPASDYNGSTIMVLNGSEALLQWVVTLFSKSGTKPVAILHSAITCDVRIHIYMISYGNISMLIKMATSMWRKFRFILFHVCNIESYSSIGQRGPGDYATVHDLYRC